MAVFDLFKRLVNQNAAPAERRGDERLRAALGARVLVVDDSATIRAVLGKMLAQDGYETLKAADGESAVEMAQSQLPDLIFLDIVLPGISGFAVLRSLRRDSRTRTTPIIMMSGNQQATEQFYVQRFGADGFVKKPFGRAEVFHAIRSLVLAGRMPARLEVAPLDVIPDGMTQEEWNAIPDVGMPDEAHVASADSLPDAPVPAAAPAATGGAQPVALASDTVRLAVPAEPLRAGTAVSTAPAREWSMPAIRVPMHSTVGGGVQAPAVGPSAPLIVHVRVPEPAAPPPPAASAGDAKQVSDDTEG